MTLISLDAGEKLAGLEKVVETEDDAEVVSDVAPDTAQEAVQESIPNPVQDEDQE